MSEYSKRKRSERNRRALKLGQSINGTSSTLPAQRGSKSRPTPITEMGAEVKLFGLNSLTEGYIDVWLVNPDDHSSIFIGKLKSPHASKSRPTPITKKSVCDLAHGLGLHRWYQGDDGFGGEWEINKGVIECIEGWLDAHGIKHA